MLPAPIPAANRGSGGTLSMHFTLAEPGVQEKKHCNDQACGKSDSAKLPSWSVTQPQAQSLRSDIKLKVYVCLPCGLTIVRGHPTFPDDNLPDHANRLRGGSRPPGRCPWPMHPLELRVCEVISVSDSRGAGRAWNLAPGIRKMKEHVGDQNEAAVALCLCSS